MVMFCLPAKKLQESAKTLTFDYKYKNQTELNSLKIPECVTDELGRVSALGG